VAVAAHMIGNLLLPGGLRCLARDVVIGSRFLRDLPSHLSERPLSHADREREIHGRMKRRAGDLMALVRRTVFSRPQSLYAQLLKGASCEPEDLSALLEREGVEGALDALCRAGVYLTLDEFKGRCPVIRGSTVLEGGPDAVRNPLARFHVPLRTSGSRGAGTPVLIDLAYIRDAAVDTEAMLGVRGADWTLRATWEVPGGGALVRHLELGSCGRPLSRWFSQLPPGLPGLHPRYRWSVKALRLGGRMAGVDVPSPEHASLEDPLPIVLWMADVLRSGREPLLFSFPSAALRLAERAAARGTSLDGAHVITTGEPMTAARLAALRRQGLRVIARYGTIEVGAIAYGCLAAKEPDDLHVLDDMHGLIRVGEGEAAGLPGGALLVTTLRSSAPFVFLNVSMGDAGVLEERRCGCGLERLGWTRHLHTVRSFEKLSGAGMTFHDADVIRILEEVLPGRFGGSPTDYQLVEGETPEGHSLVRLRVHPRVGAADEADVRETFLSALGAGSDADQVMSEVWRRAGFPGVERVAPHATFTGKVLHFHRVAP
jgi:hypothetical protein